MTPRGKISPSKMTCLKGGSRTKETWKFISRFHLSPDWRHHVLNEKGTTEAPSSARHCHPSPVHCCPCQHANACNSGHYRHCLCFTEYFPSLPQWVDTTHNCVSSNLESLLCFKMAWGVQTRKATFLCSCISVFSLYFSPEIREHGPSSYSWAATLLYLLEFPLVLE